jgi:hypothetical protein
MQQQGQRQSVWLSRQTFTPMQALSPPVQWLNVCCETDERTNKTLWVRHSSLLLQQDTVVLKSQQFDVKRFLAHAVQ